MPRLRIATCQINTRVGDLDGNVERVLDAYDRRRTAGCDLAVFPELAVTGYPPEDLLLKPRLRRRQPPALDKLAARDRSCAAMVGFVDAGRDLYNAAAVCAGRPAAGVYRKRLLPNYAVFDEQRYFAPGADPSSALRRSAACAVGVSICEDAWSPNGPDRRRRPPAEPSSIVNLNASPYYAGTAAERSGCSRTRAADASCALVYVNQVGGQDELVFDGGSMVFDADGELLAARARSSSRTS